MMRGRALRNLDERVTELNGIMHSDAAPETPYRTITKIPAIATSVPRIARSVIGRPRNILSKGTANSGVVASRTVAVDTVVFL